MINNYKNKRIAIVTGASTGIGREVAVSLSEQGYIVMILARREDKLLETKNLIEAKGGEAIVYKIDLSDISQVKKFINYVKTITNKVELIVNTAGVWHNETNVFANTNFGDFNENVVVQTLNVGVTAPTLIIHGLINLMPQNSNIVNISGTFENGAKGWLPYYLSKKAIEDLTIGLSEELKDKQIYVNCISPSDTATEEYKKFFPQYIAESASVEEVGKEIIKFCINKKKTTGEIKIVKKVS